MPNTPALVLCGMSAMCGNNNVLPQDLAEAEEILSAIGKVIVVEEDDMDAVTGLSGSGPAYLFYLAEAMMEAGVALGRYSAEGWFRTIDVPTAIVVTTQDRAILPEDQMQLALNIPGAQVFCIDLGHGACIDPRFADGLVRACTSVAGRAERAELPARRARVRGWVKAHVDSLLR